MARFILLAAFVVLAFWIVRYLRGAPKAPPPTRADVKPQEMVACEHCGVHLPRADALPATLPGRGGVFCCEDHRREHEAR